MLSVFSVLQRVECNKARNSAGEDSVLCYGGVAAGINADAMYWLDLDTLTWSPPLTATVPLSFWGPGFGEEMTNGLSVQFCFAWPCE